MSVLKKFFKDTIIYGIAAVLPKVINFLLVKVHTDALPKAAYAENANFYILASLFSVLLTFGFETAFFRFFKKETDKDVLVGTSFISLIVSAFIFLLLAISFSDWLIQIFGFSKNPLQFKLFVSIMAIDVLAVIPFAFLRATNRPIKYMVIKLINVGVIVFINLLFLKYIPQYIIQKQGFSLSLQTIYNSTAKVNFIFIANLIGSSLVFLLLLPYLFKFKWRFSKPLFLKMIRYSWPIAVAGVAYIINENLDKILIGNMIGNAKMGVYAACYKLAIFMNLYNMAFRLGAEPFFFSYSDKKNAKETYAKILNYFVIIGSLVLVVIVAFIDVLKVPFINSAYWEAIIIVPIVLLANLFLGIYHNLAFWYKLTDKTKYGMYFSIIGAMVTVIVNLLLIPKLGFIASAWATLAAYGVMMLLSYFVGRKQYYIPYNIKKIIIYLTISISISFISFTYFREKYSVLIPLLLLFLAIVLYVEKDDFLKILKRTKNADTNS